MSKWKCEICGSRFENFHVQGFDNMIYCPLCYFKKLSADLQVENQKLKRQLEENKNQQQEFIKYLEDEFNKIQKEIEKENNENIIYFKIERRQTICKILQKYKEIIGDKDEKNND